ncbi:unnamed protein product [Schistosoma margrebowiei]|uniref:Uncharacterized protein n=1 Tax=Schistosoma margrebowiei TaxID=48269 RepID=A0A183MQN8_9TREM|nr:unnamed protein product [Schistosoma margrebowiei]
MKVKTVSFAAGSVEVDHNIHEGKIKILKYSSENANIATNCGEAINEGKTLPYLYNIIDEQGGFDADVKEQIDKARTSCLYIYVEIKVGSQVSGDPP